MSPTQTNLLQGTLDLLILKSLALGEMHGLGISRRIEQVTHGTFQVKPGIATFLLFIAWRKRAGLALSGVIRKITAGPSSTGSPRQENASWERKRSNGRRLPWRWQAH